MVNAKRMKAAVAEVAANRAKFQDYLFNALLDLALTRALVNGDDTAMLPVDEIDQRNYERCRDKLKSLGYTIKATHMEAASNKVKFWVITW